MSKADTSRIEALDAILAEKRKHEGFLAKLEDRRGSTPANVFGRLRDEYLTKITDLQVRASIESESLADGLKEDEAAVAEIETRLAALTEERIEGELRAEVGEYDPKEWGERLKALNSNLAKIEKERDTKVASFERTRALLAEAQGPLARAEPPAPPATEALAPQPVPSLPEPSPVLLEPVAEQPIVRTSAAEAMRAVPATPAAPPIAIAPPAAEYVVPPSPAPAPPPRAATPAVAPRVVERTPVPAAAAPVGPPPVPAPSEPTPPARAPAAAPSPMAGSPSFDELAFLNSVVGRASVPLKAEPPAPRPSRPISELRDTSPDRAAANPAPPVAPPARAPKAAEQAEEGDSGPLGRPTPRTSQAIKTLKCSECGTLNYPTEWYCERCGGELAAL